MKNRLFMRKNIFKIAIAIFTGLMVFVSSGPALAENQQSWVKVTGTTLSRDGKPFKFIGANSVNLVFYDDWDLDIEKAIRTARENNISVLRLYIDLGWGKNEDFDRIFDIASKYGVYIILTFTDCCCSSDYPTLKKYFEVHAPLCNITNKYSVNAFKKLIKQIIERKNSINGKPYRDDPVILAWEIANELEYAHFNSPDVHKWLSEISSYIKSLDKNHLVTIGINASGDEFIKNGSIYKMFDVPGLDFFSFHFYPPSEGSDPGKETPLKENLGKIKFITKKFISLGKPVIMGEFAFTNSMDINLKTRSDPDTRGLYNAVFKKYLDTAFLAGCSGAMFWGWGIPEEKDIPTWWSKESHSVLDKDFSAFIKEYHVPRK
ncbi:MAG: cellulase family glycosylhydrolase [Candidatus Omnitrophica bacterium]|nr:cellulase family glycosylhydrolase [Candidatus Omnitrophota bacterium]